MDEKIYSECSLCRQSIEYGAGVYDGKPSRAWDNRLVCYNCRRANWDGIVKEHHPEFFVELERDGIEVVQNDKGWIPIPD